LIESTTRSELLRVHNTKHTVTKFTDEELDRIKSKQAKEFSEELVNI
jgi:hypothetical protein